jgi:hypothetical protein
MELEELANIEGLQPWSSYSSQGFAHEARIEIGPGHVLFGLRDYQTSLNSG